MRYIILCMVVALLAFQGDRVNKGEKTISYMANGKWFYPPSKVCSGISSRGGFPSERVKRKAMIVDYPDHKPIGRNMKQTGFNGRNRKGCTIDKLNGTVSFTDKKGNILLQDRQEIRTGRRQREPTFRVEQHFKLTPVEAIYGLGQFQDRIMNYRGMM